MLVKNILIEDNNGKIRVEVSDADMSTKTDELKISTFIDSLIEDLLTDDDFGKFFGKLINKEKNKEYNKTYFHQCPLCLKEVNANEEFIVTITKGVLKRHFAHTSCFNKLLKRRK